MEEYSESGFESRDTTAFGYDFTPERDEVCQLQHVGQPALKTRLTVRSPFSGPSAV